MAINHDPSEVASEIPSILVSKLPDDTQLPKITIADPPKEMVAEMMAFLI